MRKYFAYGSNLNVRQMKDRCPECSFCEGIKLNASLHFVGGVLTIEYSKTEKIPGIIYNISYMDEKVLDRYEGFPHLYIKKTFEYKGESVMFYQMKDSSRIAPPSDSYYNTVLEGYKNWGFDIGPLKKAYYEAQEYIIEGVK